MTKSTFTRERLEKIKSWRETYGAGSNVMLPAEEAEELSRMALAAMDNEPVALQPELAKVIYHFRDWNEGFPVERFKADYVISWMLANYPPAQPAPERNQVRSAHAEWSQATFGNVGPVGPLKHLSKEALEAAEQPGDLSEWADMQFLLWDAQRRAGITDEQITQAMIDKLAVNKQRSWPEPKDGEPRLHIKEQQAPVVEREPIAWLNDAYLARGVVDGEAGSEDAGPGYIPVYREAGPQQAPVVTDDLLSMAASAIEDLLEHTDPNTSYYSGVWADVPGKLRAAMLQAGNSPVIPEGWQVEAEKMAEMYGMSFVLFRHGEKPQCADPTKVVISFTDKGLGHDTPPAATAGIPMIPDGYVMVPMRLTAENGAKGALSGEFSETKFVNCPECFGADECETCDGSGRIEIKVPVSWTTIKDIWIKGVEHFAAAPQENN